MKRQKVLKYIERFGARFVREGRRHTIYVLAAKGRRTAVPRHPEIHADMVRKICRDLDIEPPAEK